ncbi:MAG: hypothetical protein EOO01_06015 [Chitinophagaceae bacterium]|nr:MAG: hypothetical protein EOO01_06015 [Chitinophagaceae bacterium]
MPESHEPVKGVSTATAPISLYSELRLLLLAGVVIFSAGIGGLIYESRGSLAHILAVISVACISAGCFIFGYFRKSPFSTGYVEEKEPLFDFVILLGALTLLTTVAYLQFRFNFFGTRYGLATFVPMALLFFAAYFYDHSGVLGMAVTNLAAWTGIVAAPRAFGLIRWEMTVQLVSTGIALTFLLEMLSWISKRQNFKAHFSSVYHWASLNLGFISVLTGLFNLEMILFIALMLVCAYYFYRHANHERSFAQLLITLLYSYIGFAYLFIKFLNKSDFPGMSAAYLGIFYFLLTAVIFARVLIYHHKKFKE